MTQLTYLALVTMGMTCAFAHPTRPSSICWNHYTLVKTECTNTSLAQWHLSDNQAITSNLTADNERLAYCCAFLEFKKCARHNLQEFCTKTDIEYVNHDLQSMILLDEGCTDDRVAQCSPPEVSKVRINGEVEIPVEEPVEEPDDDPDPRFPGHYGKSATIYASSILIINMLIIMAVK